MPIMWRGEMRLPYNHPMPTMWRVEMRLPSGHPMPMMWRGKMRLPHALLIFFHSSANLLLERVWNSTVLASLVDDSRELLGELCRGLSVGGFSCEYLFVYQHPPLHFRRPRVFLHGVCHSPGNTTLGPSAHHKYKHKQEANTSGWFSTGTSDWHIYRSSENKSKYFIVFATTASAAVKKMCVVVVAHTRTIRISHRSCAPV
jgi:hypothetical protein